MLVDWEFDEIAPEVMLEELHTAFELTLRRVANRRYKRQGSFRELVEMVDAAPDGLSVPLLRVNKYSLRGSQGPEVTYRELLISLNDARSPSRHSGRATAEQWLLDYGLAAAELLEYLAPRAWSKDATGEETAS
jgi:hypothetical protein